MNYLRHGTILAILIVCLLVAAGCTSTSSSATGSGQSAAVTTPAASQGSILVYAGAGLKAPLDEIGPLFTEKTGIAVQYNYGGAGTLVSQMNLTKKGDVFMPGSTTEFKTAKSQGLVNESKLVAYHIPVIAVQKGNPKNITTLADFAQPGLKVALGDANATAIGKASTKMFAALNISAAVEKNVVSRTPTINELTVIMQTGQADAAVLTLDQYDAKTMDMITIPLSQNVVLITPIGATTFSKNTDAANQFVSFVASDDGKAIFAKHGFVTYPNATYANVTP
ncbi:molybdate ABC transporter substrate-binding protein [Methanoregula sp.]|uniref:molybdate ABC transporter substrate-binding protein n=1 Tax=Methanoregula sp. TaxID=2052170 RepID=UPI0035642EC9